MAGAAGAEATEGGSAYGPEVGLPLGATVFAGALAWELKEDIWDLITQKSVKQAITKDALKKLVAATPAILAYLGKNGGSEIQKLYEIYASQQAQYPIVTSKWWRPFMSLPELVTLNVGDTWKFGTTKKDNVIGPAEYSRYGYSALPPGLKSQVIFTGNKLQVRFLESVLIMQYYYNNGDLPPGNKVPWKR
ncbi:MAG: hypothetical protein Q8937_16905 [Bacteroidota bacterium]|nr:hypothetical protein [Bacteroidota bacterium]